MNPKYTSGYVPVSCFAQEESTLCVYGELWLCLVFSGAGASSQVNTLFCCHTMHMWNMLVLQQLYPHSNIWMRAECELQADNSSFVEWLKTWRGAEPPHPPPRHWPLDHLFSAAWLHPSSPSLLGLDQASCGTKDTIVFHYMRPLCKNQDEWGNHPTTQLIPHCTFLLDLWLWNGGT